MPRLDTPDEFKSHLKEAVASRSRWVFLTDHTHGFDVLMGLVLAMIARGSLPAVFAGAFGLVDGRTGHLFQAGVVTIPKAVLKRKELRRALAAAGIAGPGQHDDRDLFQFSEDPARLAIFLQQVVDDRIRPVGDPATN